MQAAQAETAAAAAQQEEGPQGGEAAAAAKPTATPSPPKPAAPSPKASPPSAKPKAPEARPASSGSLSSSTSGEGRMAGVKASDLAAHRLVQRVLQVTADTAEASSSSSGLILVDYSGGDSSQPAAATAEGQPSPPVLFTVDAVSELICSRLSLRPGQGGLGSLPQQQGVLYLGASCCWCCCCCCCCPGHRSVVGHACMHTHPEAQSVRTAAVAAHHLVAPHTTTLNNNPLIIL